MFSRRYDLDVYMKSGNVIHLKKLNKFNIEIKLDVPEITNFKWIDTKFLKLRFIDLKQVEAVVLVRQYRRFF